MKIETNILSDNWGGVNKESWNEFYRDILIKLPMVQQEFFYLAQIVASNCKGRKIITWIRSSLFEKILKEHFNLSVEFGVSQTKKNINGTTIKSFESLKGHSKDYYLVSLDSDYSKEDYKILNDYGYEELKDFVYRKHKPIILENFDFSQQMYLDVYGNTIEGIEGTIKKIEIKGCNNHIHFGKDIKGLDKIDILLFSNSKIDIDDECKFRNEVLFQLCEYNGTSSIEIGKKCRFGKSLFKLYKHGLNSSILINDSCTFEDNLTIRVNQGKQVVIGKDCMLSYNITIMSGDGHSIFDVKTGKNINVAYERNLSSKNAVIIGNHVWVGYGAFILYGTNVGDGGIIGANSVVKGIFSNNCSIVGNPAVMVRKDIAWSRQGASNNISTCGKENINLTSYAKPTISGKNVLVIGGTRFMGVQLVKELLAKGNNVTIATRGNKKDSFGNRIDRIIMDVADSKSVENALSDKHYDVVFDNLAYCSNYVRNILSVVKCKRYVQLSSTAVYGSLEPNMEEISFNPLGKSIEWCDESVSYARGKRQAEIAVYQIFPNLSTVTVRIPYVTETERLYFYCKCIVKQIPMRITDTSRGLTFVRDTEVGRFLPWIAAQDYEGPINLASEGMLTLQMIIEYIESKTGKKAIYDFEKGVQSPFNENTFSVNTSKAANLGYPVSNIHDWFWNMMDKYIERALKEE